MTQISDPVENFLGLLDGVRKTSTGWVARCPCRNDDSNPSLSVSEGNDGRVLVTCHRAMSCNVDEICSSVGLRVSDLMPQDSKPVIRNAATDKPIKTEKKPIPTQKPKLTFVESYDFVDENHQLLFQKVRYVDENGKKSFSQRKPDGRNGWVYALGDTPKVLYNLPAVLEAKKNGVPIWVVEGEKDANTLIDMGIVATTMPGGAGKWLDIHTEALAGAVVEVIADNDEIGVKHANEVVETLSAAGCSAQAWVCPSHKDITDHMSSGGSIDGLLPIFEDAENQDFEQIDFEEVEAESPQTPEDAAIEKLSELIARTDLNAKQKIAKSNLIIASSTVSFVLDTGRLVQWNEFLSETTGDTYEWVIPGLLEKSERVIVVAAEGVGKTMLARQVGILTAAGINPFSFQQMPRITTLTVDLENPERIIRRTSRSIALQAMSHARTDSIDAHLLSKPSGMDLLKAADRAILEDALDQVRPQLLVIGPLYKAFLDPGGRTSESIAIEVAKYLDTIRVVYGCALWIEHHAPLGTSSTSRDLRPFGSAVWSRWPEFGLSLQPDPTAGGDYVYDVKHFRGARDERHWPLKMKRGKRFPFEVIEWMKTTT